MTKTLEERYENILDAWGKASPSSLLLKMDDLVSDCLDRIQDLEAEPTEEEIREATKAVSLSRLGRDPSDGTYDEQFAKAALEAAAKVRETKE